MKNHDRAVRTQPVAAWLHGMSAPGYRRPDLHICADDVLVLGPIRRKYFPAGASAVAQGVVKEGEQTVPVAL